MEWHLSLHGDAHFSNLEMQHSPKMSATFSKKDLQKTNFTQYAGFFFHTVAVFDIDVLRNLDIGMTYLIDDRRIVNVSCL